MNFRRSLVLSGLLLAATLCNPTFAQRRRYEGNLRQPCELEVFTQLEEFQGRVQTIIVRGSTHLMTVTARNGTARVDAIELRDESNGSRATGVVIELRDSSHPDDEARSYIDYEEINRVIKAWDQVARTDDTITKLNNFESRYRTRGDLEIAVFRQTPGGSVAATLSGGICNRVRIFLSLDELIKLRHLVAQAKERLDEIK